jgi:malate/lactate dehydrogenase
VTEVVNDEAYLQEEFINKVSKRGGEIIQETGKSSAASAAVAACDHVKSWWYGNPEDSYVSMGVIQEGGKYGVDGDLCFSYPCTIKNGEWEIIEGLEIDEFSREKINLSMKELQEERKLALGR